MELLLEQKDPLSTGEKIKKSNQRKSNRMEHHEFPTRPKQKAQSSELDSVVSEPLDLNYEQPKTNEEKARYLFDKAVQLEQQGRHYEAIKFYRMSMQLDADIEFKLATNKKTKTNKTIHNNKTNASDYLESEDSENDDGNEKLDKLLETKGSRKNSIQSTDENDDLKTLYEKFHSLTIDENRLCDKNFPQKVNFIVV